VHGKLLNHKKVSGIVVLSRHLLPWLRLKTEPVSRLLTPLAPSLSSRVLHQASGVCGFVSQQLGGVDFFIHHKIPCTTGPSEIPDKNLITRHHCPELYPVADPRHLP